jgi:hypothetical protein
MLQESGCGAPATLNGSCQSSFGQAVCAPGSECAPAPAVACFEANWFVSARGLMMGRNGTNRLWTTYESNNNPNQMMNSDLDMGWSGGGEIRFGRWFCCGTVGVESVYWTLDPMNAWASAGFSDGRTVGTPLLVNDIEFNDGVNPPVNGTALFDGARRHSLHRVNEFQNVEVNMLFSQPETMCEGLLDVDVFAGARYFRFYDSLRFASLAGGGTWGGSGTDEAYLNDRVINNLVGAQLGCNVNYLLGYNLRLFFNPSIGAYNNHIQNLFELYRGDGVVATPTAASGMQAYSYPVNSHKDVLAFLTQIDLGLDWQFAPNWNAYIGYRVLIATGIGNADAQIPPYVVDIPEIADIDYNGELILHGAFAGLTLRF